MKNTSKFIIISLVAVLSMLILSIGLASANTLVGGTIFQGTPENPISGVTITVQCDSLYLDTVSLNDGTYAVVFDKESCSVIDAVAKGDEYKAMELTVYIKDDTNEPQKPDTAGNKVTSGRIYLCGNGICDSGETSNTCIRDCPYKPESIQPQSVSKDNTENTSPEVITLEQNTNVSGNPPITGAVTGIQKNSNFWAIIAIVLLLLVMGFFIIRQLTKKEDISEYK